jgi:hypothetical protein
MRSCLRPSLFGLHFRQACKKADRVPAKTDRLRDGVRGNWWGQPSSGNRAFDDYRADTLRRLEDEQREFKEFLKRLRVARTSVTPLVGSARGMVAPGRGIRISHSDAATYRYTL